MRVFVTESYYRSNELDVPYASGDSSVLDHGKSELAQMRPRSGINGVEDILQAPSLQDVMVWLSDDTNFKLSELDEHDTVGYLKQQTSDHSLLFQISLARLNGLVDQVLHSFLGVIILVSRSLRLWL